MTFFYGLNEQYVKDMEARGFTQISNYSHAVVNRGESYILYNGKWSDWADLIPTVRSYLVRSLIEQKEEWIDIDNFSIKVYADFIERDLSAEATKIGTTGPAATVGVSDEDTAEQYALFPLARVHNKSNLS